MTVVWRRIASNAMANVFTGASATVFQIGVTALAARSFDASNFSAWTLALSLAALTPLFAASLSSIVTRQLVGAEQAGTKAQAVIMVAARRLARQLGVVAMVSILCIAFLLHHVSTPLASVSLWVFAGAALALTVGQLWQIELQPAIGWHYARQRNWTVTVGIAVARISSLVAMGGAAWFFRNNLPATALCLAIGTWLGLAFAIKSGFQGASKPVDDAKAIGETRAETMRLIRGFAVWSIGSAAIQYGLPPFMSIITGSRYNAFYLAYTLNMVVTGVGAAGASALLAPVTRMHAQGDSSGLLRWMNRTPLLTGLALIVVFFALLLSIQPLVHLWAPGMAQGGDVRDYLYLLGFQTIARSMALFFSVLLSAAGNRQQLSAPIIIELAVTGLVALPVGWLYGDHAFIAALAGAGLVAAVVVAATTVQLVDIDQRHRRAVLARFCATQVCVLGAWYFLGK